MSTVNSEHLKTLQSLRGLAAVAMPRLQESHLAPDTTAMVISSAVAAITLAVAALVYRYVELPFIALGRKVADGIAAIFRTRADHVV